MESALATALTNANLSGPTAPVLIVPVESCLVAANGLADIAGFKSRNPRICPKGARLRGPVTAGCLIADLAALM